MKKYERFDLRDLVVAMKGCGALCTGNVYPRGVWGHAPPRSF